MMWDQLNFAADLLGEFAERQAPMHFELVHLAGMEHRAKCARERGRAWFSAWRLRHRADRERARASRPAKSSRACLTCDTAFVPSTSRQVRCSAACRQAAKNAQRPVTGNVPSWHWKNRGAYPRRAA